MMLGRWCIFVCVYMYIHLVEFSSYIPFCRYYHIQLLRKKKSGLFEIFCDQGRVGLKYEENCAKMSWGKDSCFVLRSVYMHV